MESITAAAVVLMGAAVVVGAVAVVQVQKMGRPDGPVTR